MTMSKAEINVFQWLESVRSYARRENLHEGIDVRLGRNLSGEQYCFEGDASLDTIHCDACATGCVMPDTSDDELAEIARGLIDDCEDQFAWALELDTASEG